MLSYFDRQCDRPRLHLALCVGVADAEHVASTQCGSTIRLRRRAMQLAYAQLAPVVVPPVERAGAAVAGRLQQQHARLAVLGKTADRKDRPRWFYIRDAFGQRNCLHVVDGDLDLDSGLDAAGRVHAAGRSGASEHTQQAACPAPSP